ncbi:MAG: type II secretion system secretin GspD [Gammaproteobacteria bacterium]|nr:type II secretion system secretin GspD [Gammaproteobacteria bacterium]
MKTVLKPLLLLAAGMILALQMGLGAAQTDDAPGGDQITLNFQDVDIRALINTVSEITGRNFIVDPRVRGQVTVVSGGPLAADQIYEVFLSVLAVHNFAAVPSGDVTKIIPNNIVKQEPTPTTYGETEPVGEDQITQVYKLQHASVQELVPILRPLLPPTSHFAAHAPSNTLVFTDTRANVRRIIDIIGRMDLPDRGSNVRVVFLDHARAADLVTVLSQLATNFNVPQGEGGQRTRQVSVQADEATNALIINAPDSEFRLLQAVVDQLDVERPTQKDIHVMYLEYAKASDLVDILNQVSEGLVETEGGQAADRRITVQADESANALVIHARPKEFQSIEAVIKQLDVKRKQVFVEAIIAEVSFNKAADLGIEWRGSTSDVTSGGQLTGSTEFSDISGGLTLGFINQFIVNAAGLVVPDLEIILRALRSDSHTNILSTPNLLTLNNEEAEIIVGQEVPFVTGQFTTPVSTGNQDQDGGVNPFQTIERRDVGLSLKITPQINAGETITMEVEQEISNVSETTVQGASDLITDERRINATVQVDSGQIVVIGGLIRDDVLDTVEWVPVLGRIPIIGELFKRKQKSAVKTNLMVFLRPRIVEDGTGMAESTRKKYEYMRELSKDSQPGTRNIIHRRKPPVLPEVTNWRNPDVDLEPEVIPEGPKMLP